MTTHLDIPTQKKLMRAHQVEVRRLACAQYGASAAEALTVIVEPGTVVAAYWPMGDELDPRPLMRRLEQQGCRLALPVVAARGQPLDFRAYGFGDTLEPGLHGTFHPALHAAPLVPQVMLVPLLAFDRQCFRLGYGGGYYDRTLESLRQHAQIRTIGQVRTIGLGFAAQEVAVIPRDGHDQRLDAIATETGLITPETE